MTQRVVIVVDNPLRDLSGSLLVASDLSRFGIEVFLVEMYNQIFDITFLKPHLVLLNFVRDSNINLIKYYNSLGIKVAILDTEGAWSENLDSFSNAVQKKIKLVNIAQYFLWGNKQLKSLTKNKPDGNNIFSVTGSPRYDFCFGRLKNNLEPKKNYAPYFLINTRFPRSNPEFTNGEDQEILGMMAAGYSKKNAMAYLSRDKIAQKEMLVIISNLAKKYPNYNFVVRPHPFENISKYQDSLTEKNIYVVKEGSSINWINSAELLIHLNCTTAIESFFLKIPTVNLKWLSHPILDAPIAERASTLNATSYNQLLKFIDKYATKKKIKKESGKKNKIIDFYANSGKSSKLISKKIVTILKNNLQDNNKFRRYDDLKIFSRVIFGFRLFIFFTYILKPKLQTKREGKAINFEYLDELLRNINKSHYTSRSVSYGRFSENSFKFNWLASNKIIQIQQ